MPPRAAPTAFSPPSTLATARLFSQFPCGSQGSCRDYALMARLSAALPAWAFIYCAPGTTVTARPDGTYDDIEYPLLLNQGRVLYFVNPATAAAVR